MQYGGLKRFIYGLFFLLILGGFVYGSYALFSQDPASCIDQKQNQNEEGVDCGGECASCEFQTIKPLQVTSTTLFHSGTDQLSVSFELTNPNTRHGAELFTYKVSLVNTVGTEITSIIKTSFIYPGEIKTMIEAGIQNKGLTISRADIVILDAEWRERKNFDTPKTQLRDIQINFNAETRRAVITGIIINEDAGELREATVSALIRNPLGTLVGASQTFLENIDAFDERFFQITIPEILLGSVTRDLVELFVAAKQ